MSDSKTDPSSAPPGDPMRKLLEQKDLLKTIVGSIADTISSYTQTPVTPGKVLFKEKADKKEIAVAGLIRFDGPECPVELFLGFSKDLFSFFYENMFQTSVEEISPENHDLAGEILNIAFGSMDPKFRQLGYHMRSSFPKVYSGGGLAKMLALVPDQAISVPFAAGNLKFVVEIYLANSLNLDWQYSVPK